MRKIIKKIFGSAYLRAGTVAGLVLLFILVPAVEPARAEGGPLSLGSLALGFGMQAIDITLEITQQIVLRFVSFGAEALNWVLRLNITRSLTVLQPIWEITRDFANMFFIVFLIIMAFATIFDLGGSLAGYDVGSLIVKFLIAALLINFSMVIGREIILLTNVANDTFLASIGGIGDRIQAGLKPSELINTADNPATPTIEHVSIFTGCLTSFIGCVGEAVSQIVANEVRSVNSKPEAADAQSLNIVSKVFTLVLASIAMFSLLTPFVFALIRIPVLWFLLVMSPLAWLCSVLPSTRSISQSWWKNFWGWNLFLPIYLFFLSISINILGQQNKIMTELTAAFPGGPISGGKAVVQLVFFYIFVGISMLGGLAMAFKSSFIAGTGASTAAGWARGAVGRISGVTAVGQGLSRVGKQVREEGLPGRLGGLYGGQQALERQATGVYGAVGGILGLRGVDIAKQKSFVDAAGKEFSTLEQQNNTGRINVDMLKNQARAGRADDPIIYARRKLLAKLGQLDDDLFIQTARELSSNPLAVEDFAKTAKESKFSDVQAETMRRVFGGEKGIDEKTGKTYDYSDFRTNANMTPLRREMAQYIQSDSKAASKVTEEQFRQGVEILGGYGSSAGKNYLKEFEKVRPDFVMKYRIEKGVLKPEEGQTIEETRYNAIRGATNDMKEVSLMPLDVWKDPLFMTVLRDKLTNPKLGLKARRNMRSRLEELAESAPKGKEKLELLSRIPRPPEYEGGKNREDEEEVPSS